MSRKKKLVISLVLVALALLGWWLYKKYAAQDMPGEESNPVDKALRFIGMEPKTKDMRFEPSTTGKAEPFYNMPVKPDKDIRFDAGTTGKNIRFT